MKIMGRIESWVLVFGVAMAGCSASPEDSATSTLPLDANGAMAACEASQKNCVDAPSCNGDSLVATFGGDSSAGIPIHPDEVDGWVYAGPHAGDVIKFVTTTTPAGVIEPAAYGCSTTLPAPPMQIVGSW